ncbi:hypothetical protein [Stigmatella aurantiaca]|uniref:Uncharacterized protein n=1 Tax=Stigmatella aurantiaca (strain DW4/3-1) TaxID=378806 RepID=E3FT42_STIAD|nr:hypothetical protein [Stigmatella aurantiaca]ADO75852.1 uncharacterized protein STAUR_8097 [Stigmatella aurantiaca DW4/3-1]
MKSMTRSNRSSMQVQRFTPEARSTVAIAVTPQRTNVSIPHKPEALVATGAILVFAGLVLAALDE